MLSTRIWKQSGLLLVLSLGISNSDYSNATDKSGKKKSSTPVKVKNKSALRTGKNKIITRAKTMMSKQQQIDFAKSDLITRMNIAPEKVSLSGAIRVTWKSGALGCPEAGMNYTQALIPGVLIMLKVDNKAYRYHASVGGRPSHCPESKAESHYVDESDI